MGEATKIPTELLRRSINEPAAAMELLPILYGELRNLASGYMVRERVDHTLQPTALVHEAFFKLMGSAGDVAFTDRAHFLGFAARAMRQVLVDHSRQRGAQKRGGGQVRVTFDDALAEVETDTEMIEVHEALERLALKDERLARVVELRYFGGLTIRECAAVLELSHTTVEDDWSLARAWLLRELTRGETT